MSRTLALFLMSLLIWPLQAQTLSDETLSIEQIHGQGSVSPYLDQRVTTEGIVTLVLPTGFWIQTASDTAPTRRQGLHVFTADPAPVGAGDHVRLSGYIDRFRRPDRESDRWLTRLIQPSDLVVLASDQALPPALRIGQGGLRVPDLLNDDDPRVDPRQSASDFWTWLTGMRVEIGEHRVIGPSNRFGDTWVISPGDHALLNDHGVLTARPDSDHPDRILITPHALLRPSVPRPALPGDRFETVDGIVHYDFGQFRVLARHALNLEPAARSDQALSPITALTAGPDHLTVAAYNVENLDPVIERLGRVANARDVDDAIGSGRMARIGAHIAINLASPDIVALQEIQDNNGAEPGQVVAADQTYAALIAAIQAAGGPTYAFIDLHPRQDAEGGQPGGNIRNGYLYNPQRVQLIEGSPERFDDPAFEQSRRPVLAGFAFNGHVVHLINNHFSSKGGSSPLFGEGERIVGRAEARAAQARAIRDLLIARDAWEGTAHWVVLGDLNDHWFSEPLTILKNEEDSNRSLVNLIESRPIEDRWTYIFNGTGQAIDHILATPGLAAMSEFEVVHVNARLADQAADHEPILARFHLPVDDTVPSGP